MANKELIYKITKAVYARLGTRIAETEVESLVTDIYNAIGPEIALGRQGGDWLTTAPRHSEQRLVVSVFGLDRPGIMAAVTGVLADAECSIVDINQTVVQGKFAMVLIADMSKSMESAAALKERFRAEGERLGIRIYSQREDLFNAMHRV